MKRLAALALFCGLLALNSGDAQERKTPPPDAAPATKHRALYPVQNGNAVLLAEVVGLHFKGEAVVIAAPAGSGNAVLISGAAGTVPEVVKLLEQLDRKPRTVEVEIVIAEVPAKDAEPKAEDLAKAGQRIKLVATEGQPITSTTGGNKPMTSKEALTPKGGAWQRSVSYHPVGTTAKMTARVGSDDTVSLDLSIQDSRVRPAEAGDEVGAASLENNTLTTKLNVPAGKAVVAQAIRTEGKAGATVALVIVTARVVPTNAPPKRR